MTSQNCRRTALAALVAAAALAAVAVPPASAAATDATYRQNALIANNYSYSEIWLSANVGSIPTSKVDSLGFCTRTVDGTLTAEPTRLATTIPSTGVTIRQTEPALPKGTYTTVPCVRRDAAGVYTDVGSPKTFTVGGLSLFVDGFDGPAGPALKGDRAGSRWSEWSTATYNSSAAYGNITTDAASRTRLDGQGHLVITATPDKGTSISTKDAFSFQTGTLTARMKVPGNSQPGYWPAFWTLNNNPDGHDTLPLGEIDVHESYSGLANYYHRGTHTWNGNLTWGSPGDPACGRDHVDDEWHDYSAKVATSGITFFFDGVQCGAVATKADGGGKPYGFFPDVTRGNWPILTLAVGGAGGQQDGMAKAPATMLVDSVTVTN